MHKQVPKEGDTLEITKTIRLSSLTPRLGGIVIRNGGHLVFDPTASKVVLTSNYVLIEDRGYLEIGSQDCPFDGNAEIILTGLGLS